MNDLCRLCLSVCAQNVCELSQNCELLTKTRTCLVIEIAVEEYLPNQICFSCVEKIEEILTFRKNIVQNQSVLSRHLKNGIEDLEHFYTTLKSNAYVKVENGTYTLNNKENENFVNSSFLDIHKEIKPEVTGEPEDVAAAEFSSDDDLSLSSLKKAKDQNHSKVKHKKKNKTSNIPLHNSEAQEIQGTTNISNLREKQKCLTCSAVFDTQNELLRHYNIDHGNKKLNIIGESRQTVNYTMLTKEGVMRYTCENCHKVYSNKRDINRHLITHTSERPFICKLCGRTYKTASEIIRHGRAHNGFKLDCSQCSYSTVYPGALKEHERRHRTEYKYKCEKCNKGFQVKTWYKEHQNIHEGIKPFVCNLCGLSFHMNRYLTAHRSAVHPQSSTLKRYVCVHCSLPCDSRKTLTEHLKVHGIKTSFLCDICGKTLSNVVQLNFHKRMHLGIKPYTCSTCNKSFTKKFYLKSHEITHSGERAYACSKCGKHYTQRSTLLRHNRSHHSESQGLKCANCLKSFSSRLQLTSHERLCIS